MPFAYDVFFSYRRKATYLDWLGDFFFERFQFELSNRLDSEARIFCDQKSIKLGADWPDELQRALKTSRCMVALWAPDYFRSYYCYNEWRNFQRHRTGFVMPLQYSTNRNKFPEEARRVTIEDFSPYAFTGPGFRKLEMFVAYQDAIRRFADRVAEAIERAPAEPPPFAIEEEHPPNADQSDHLIPLGGISANAALG